MSCPICRKLSRPAYRPFCSRRCADVDLARWLREDYRVPAPQEVYEDDIPASFGEDGDNRPG